MRKNLMVTLIAFLLLAVFATNIVVGYKCMLNSPPNKPATGGPDEVNVGQEALYWAETTDPDGDLLQYGWNWTGQVGSDPLTVDQWVPIEGTTDPDLWFVSGQTCTVSHTYYVEGTYQIRVIARDWNGALSEWSDAHEVTYLCNVEAQTYEQGAQIQGQQAQNLE